MRSGSPPTLWCDLIVTDGPPVNDTLSLQAQGLIGSPAAPALIVGGVYDTKVPIADLTFLIHPGVEPGEAWINLSDGHMGREAKVWADPIMLRKAILLWPVRRAKGED